MGLSRVQVKRISSLIILFCLVLFALGLSSTSVYALTFGITSPGPSVQGAGYPNLMMASRFALPSAGSVSSLSVYLDGSPSGNVRLAIYGDDAVNNVPSSLVVQSASTPVSVIGWATASISSTALNAGSYWLVAMIDNSGSRLHFGSGGPSAIKSMQFSSGFPSSWGGTSGTTLLYTVSYSLYATYSTGPAPNDFAITVSTGSQTVGAGATATYTLSIQYGSSLSATVDLGVTSGCPTGATCTFSPPSVTGSGTVTLSVPTLPTTPGGTTTITVTATSTSPALSHSVQVQLTVNPPGSYPVYVYAGASKVTVTVTWTGSGTAAIYLAGPGGSPTLSEPGAVIYDRVVYVSGSSTPTYIHRVTFTLSSPPTSTQTWNALVSLTGSYTVTIEVNSPSPTT